MDERNAIHRFFLAITPALYVSSLIFTLNSRVAISHEFNPPSCKGDSDEELSTGFQFADAETPDQKHAQIDTGGTTVISTTVPEPPYANNLCRNPPEISR
ncbi:hypothetical protein M407DRAFT_247220 [Tulasnella calospora MUT 4182]|uniref:Uncharacterized protein n=1 Tax=Tulasnella calospora MUT 4182 TaxID=1051891 RepID=A0A0C3PMD1_9AGAM|nr:hypothetical protein M407DRAFT_247220 [Tulasnella calospora MUT 4182]